MLISVTAPRKGMGQTITAINLCALISQMQKGRTALIDINKYCPDVANYLNDSEGLKGLDDFISLFGTNLLKVDSFHTCMKKIYTFDVMFSNICFELGERAVRELLKYTESIYQTVIVDTISGINSDSRKFLNESDAIIVVIEQSIYTTALITEKEIFKEYKDKLVFVINRYIGRYEDRKVGYGINEISADLKAAGYKNQIFPLVYDVDVLNSCNDKAVLNNVLNQSAAGSEYSKQLKSIAEYLTKETNGGLLDEDDSALGRRHNFRLKKALPRMLRF